MNLNISFTEHKNINISTDIILDKLELELTNILIDPRLLRDKFDYFIFSEKDKTIIGVQKAYHGSDSEEDITEKLPEESVKLIFEWLKIKNLLIKK